MANKPRITITHDYIRVNFGNNRGLSVSYSGEKASGAVPDSVFALWSNALQDDEASLAQIGLKKSANHREVVRAFVYHIDTIWPGWYVAPKLPSPGDTVRVNFGRRRGLDTGVVQSVKGTNVSILFEREGLVRMAADMLADNSE